MRRVPGKWVLLQDGINPNSPPQGRCWAYNKCSVNVLHGKREGSPEQAVGPGLEGWGFENGGEVAGRKSSVNTGCL